MADENNTNEPGSWRARPTSRGEKFTRYTPREGTGDGVRLLPGGYYVTQQPGEVIITILGSCVAACIWDTKIGIGGMNHFMLPMLPNIDSSPINDAMRFGNYAMEVLINEMLASGCQREHLEVKVFGGADLRKNFNATGGIGTNNSEFIIDYLKREKMNVGAHNLGGNSPRRIHFYPTIGKIKMLPLEKPDATNTEQEEMSLQQKMNVKPAVTPQTSSSDDDVEFF